MEEAEESRSRGGWLSKNRTLKSAREFHRKLSAVVCRPTKEAITAPNQAVIAKMKNASGIDDPSDERITTIPGKEICHTLALHQQFLAFLIRCQLFQMACLCFRPASNSLDSLTTQLTGAEDTFDAIKQRPPISATV